MIIVENVEAPRKGKKAKLVAAHCGKIHLLNKARFLDPLLAHHLPLRVHDHSPGSSSAVEGGSRPQLRRLIFFFKEVKQEVLKRKRPS